MLQARVKGKGQRLLPRIGKHLGLCQGGKKEVSQRRYLGSWRQQVGRMGPSIQAGAPGTEPSPQKKQVACLRDKILRQVRDRSPELEIKHLSPVLWAVGPPEGF